MATQLQASTPPVLADSKPGFFKTLPRELRDAVYDLLHQEVTEYVDELQFHSRTVIVKLRLISRQFRQEYDERSAKNEHNNHLTITDDEEFELSGWMDGSSQGVVPHCPALATRATSLTLNLIVCVDGHAIHSSCGARRNIEGHIGWINSLLQSLPRLQHIYVRLGLVSTSCTSKVLEQTEPLEALPNFAGLQIVGSPSLKLIGSADNSVVLVTSTKQHGLRVDHEAIELFRKRQASIAGRRRSSSEERS